MIQTIVMPVTVLSGDSYVSLQYLFRVFKQSISKTVPEVCEAIIDILKDYVKVSEILYLKD